MYDSSRYGHSKSILIADKEAGFEMTKQCDVSKFMLLYNASISSVVEKRSSGRLDSPAKHKKVKDKNKKKSRKMANASRRRIENGNRQKRNRHNESRRKRVYR